MDTIPAKAKVDIKRERWLNSIALRLIVWIMAAFGFLAVTYLAWACLSVSLWHWLNKGWWHWVFAPFAAFFLFLFVPLLAGIMAGPLIASASNVKARIWWEVVSYAGGLGTIIFTLWAFEPIPEWSPHWPWWLWSSIVIGSAIVCAAGRMFCTVYPVAAPKPRKTYSTEWKFNHSDVNSPPMLGMAMSGGGIRSAAFNLGVLHALHQEGILPDFDIMSAVSGGSYAMSWYLLQPFYAAKAATREGKEFNIEEIFDEMFRLDGKFQTYLAGDPSVVERIDAVISAIFDATVNQPVRALMAASENVGDFNFAGGARREYRDRLQELFQGLPSLNLKSKIENAIEQREQTELHLDRSDFSTVTPVNYLDLAEFAQQHHLPFFVFNATVLIQRAFRHMLWPTVFELTSCDIGSDVCGYRAWDDLKHWVVTEHLPEKMSISEWTRRTISKRGRRQRRWVLMVNLAPAISGAAIGLAYFNSKKTLRDMRLTAWTPFVSNVDLGYLLYRDIWHKKDRGALYVSDGGHSENLGAYALIKRQCKKVIIVDAEHEAAIPYIFEGYTKLKRQLAEEMHLLLSVPDIDAYLTSGISKATGPTAAVMSGDVKPLTPHASGRLMWVIYIKLGLDRSRLESYPHSVSEYAPKNSKFPQDPTSNQSFTSEQFIAYRDLGRHVAYGLRQVLNALSSG